MVSHLQIYEINQNLAHGEKQIHIAVKKSHQKFKIFLIERTYWSIT